MYLILKNIHITCAILSFVSFVTRFILAKRGIRLRILYKRILPDTLDAVFLGSGIWLYSILLMSMSENPWLVGKLSLVLAYIVFGILAMRKKNIKYFIIAVVCYFYIALIALSKDIFLGLI